MNRIKDFSAFVAATALTLALLTAIPTAYIASPH